ncbi:succinylglutamate desuccinylase [Gallaecimonas sp. GXIMD4217]|uniref:succinylglutamate desuccinylase n=1 Tax=Gallaecimonas sp. GXIMD4217 TaxID=3131927 RepID=UPI00311AFF7D
MIAHNDILALTRANPGHLAPSSFTTDGGIQVEIWDTGIFTFSPAEPGNKDIILSCGVHGNETAPMEIVRDLAKGILDGSQALSHRLLILIGNPAAINLGERQVEENLNRLFSGAHSEGEGLINDERRRAKALEDAVARFFGQRQGAERLHYDLHTAIRGSRHEKFAVYPFLHGAPRDKEQIRFLAACGVDTVLLSESPTTTFSYFSSHNFGAHAFTVELGKVRPFGENDMSRFEAAARTLAALVGGQDLTLPPYDESRLNLYKISRVINKQSEAFAFTFDDDVENFTPYPRGHLIATDGDIEHRIEAEEEAVIFPNAKVALGQRATLLVVRTTLN